MKPAIAKVSREEPRPLRTRGNTFMRFLLVSVGNYSYSSSRTRDRSDNTH